jgi:tetratricopeptide (TPR) repeat protein
MIEKHKEAIEDFLTVTKKNPKNAHAHFRLAFSYKNLEDYDKSAESFELAKALDPNNPMLVLNYKKLGTVKYIILCKPGEEKIYI